MTLDRVAVITGSAQGLGKGMQKISENGLKY